jgi:radical SAM superfamily enzyme YgiQ (UPF0313 family)
MDILFIEPNASNSYQALANKFSAIETPTWCLLLAGACRSAGLEVGILDANAERLDHSEATQRVKKINPKMVIVSCYGQNPNSSTPFFGSGASLAKELKAQYKGLIGFVGPHVAALPTEVLAKHPEIDFVLCNEGIIQLINLFKFNLDLKSVNGIAYRRSGVVLLNPAEKTVSQEELETVYTEYAWDLLPYEKEPLDLYRSHLWHADFGNLPRTPFAAIYTSLGCTFKCSFCMINMINRDSNEGEITASSFPKMRFFSAKWLKKEFDKLRQMKVKTLRISDEMFYLNRAHYKPILDLLISEKYDFNMWVYSRVDTVRKEYIDEFKAAGINWICLGIEAGDDQVRSGAFKGKFVSKKVEESVRTIRDAGVKVLANFIVGLPHDDESTIDATLQMALNLNAEYANFYPCMALPGSDLYIEALKRKIELPTSYSGYGFLAYDCIPFPTDTLSSAQVLELRDKVFNQYVSNTEYQKRFIKNFGKEALDVLNQLSAVKLKRKLLEN